jgi:putative ABC transport system permease protein
MRIWEGYVREQLPLPEMKREREERIVQEQAVNEQAIWVTEGTLRVLRVRPILGRTFTREDDTPATPRTVVLGNGYWRRRFGADPGVIGRTLRVDGNPAQIIGVMPAGFRIVDQESALYLPLRIDPATVIAGQFWYQSIARLAPGVTQDEVHADLARLMPIAIDSFPGGMTHAELEQSGSSSEASAT